MNTTPWFLGPSTRLPWRVVDNEGMFEVWTANDDTPGTLNNYAIAISIQQEDEARALAAVPELVAALRSLLLWAELWEGNPAFETVRTNVAAARAALEKAGVKG